MKRAYVLGWAALGCLGLAGFLGAACSDDPTLIEPETKSKRGESCANTNDCDEGLKCIAGALGGVCVQDSVPTGSKECVEVECTTATYLMDCCPAVDPMDPMAAALCGLICSPAGTCEDACAMDSDCSGVTPVCLAGQCVQCNDDMDCGDSSCLATTHMCVPSCTLDEHCPSLNVCQIPATLTNGVCIWVGCTTDLECVYERNDRAAKCRTDKTCSVPCTSNAACGGLQQCKNGACEALGCEIDAECREALDLVSEPTSGIQSQAVCRAAAAMPGGGT